MKTLFVGTGVIGTIYGWALAEAGLKSPIMFSLYAEVKAFLRDATLMKSCVQASKELMHLGEKGGVNLKLYPDVLFVHRPSWLDVAIIRRMWNYRS